MDAAFFRCLARVLSMAAGSLIFMLPVDRWASHITFTKDGSAYRPTMGGGSPAFALLTTNPPDPIRNILARPP
jgi:hypothetical protein